MNRGKVKCYGCGGTIRWVDTYVLKGRYYCEVCTDKMIRLGMLDKEGK